MSKCEQMFEDLLAAAGVAIDGKQPWEIQVKDEWLVHARVTGKEPRPR